MTTRVLDFADGFTSSNAPSSLGAVNIVATQSIANGGTIALGVGPQQITKVAGSGGAVILSGTPFGATPPADGEVITVCGTDNINTVEVIHNDAINGCILNGNAILGKFDKVTLVYDSTEQRYIELVGRNF